MEQLLRIAWLICVNIIYVRFSECASVAQQGLQLPDVDAGLNSTGQIIRNDFSSPAGCKTGNSVCSSPQVSSTPVSKKPNILVIIADDLGHADIGYSEGNHQTPTPNLDKLAWDGIILNWHYTNSVCSPTRSAFLTGKYAFQIGMQSFAIGVDQPWGVPLNLKLLPQYLKELDYNTIMLGKWHIGSHTRAYLPNARGFDYWFGHCYGDTEFFNYTTGWITPVPTNGRDLYENGKQVSRNHTNNHYFPDLLVEKFEQFLHKSDSSKPWFVQFATPLSHSSTQPYGKKVQLVMPQYALRPAVASMSEAFSGRKQQLSLIQALDEHVKRITTALTNKGVLNDTIIAFFSDNGPATRLMGLRAPNVNYGSSWPLRMFKNTAFEGGVRSLAFIWSPLFKRRGFISNQLFHVTDWLPTLYEAAGGNPVNLGNISGISQYQSLKTGNAQRNNLGPRTELPINIDSIINQYGIIIHGPFGNLYKLVGGNVYNNSYTGWERTEGTTVENEMRTWTPASVDCNFPPGVESIVCKPWLSDCLFDITNDPCETTNIAAKFPLILNLLQKKIKDYNATSVPAAVTSFDPKSNPLLWDDWWVPWLDPDPVQMLPYSPFTPSSAT